MKILFLSHSFFPFIGGIEVISEMLCKSFTAAGHEVHLLTWTEDANNTPLPFKIIRCPNYIQLLQEHAWADMVFENNPCLRLSWPSIFFKKPSVIALQTWISRTNGKIAIQDRLKLKWLKRAAHVIAVSDAVQRACFPAATVIGNPYRAEEFKLQEGKRHKDFLFLGRLVDDKGADLAIKAIHQLEEKHSLTIIGEGPELDNLKQLTKKLGIEDRVIFTGPLRGEALVDCLNQHQYMLVPSMWQEPFGIVALEGIACGCLPIVSDGGGLPDAVGRAGLTFKRGDLNALVACIKNITANPLTEIKIRAAAQQHLINFHPNQIIGEYLKIIESINQPQSLHESTYITSYK